MGSLLGSTAGAVCVRCAGAVRLEQAPGARGRATKLSRCRPRGKPPGQHVLKATGIDLKWLATEPHTGILCPSDPSPNALDQQRPLEFRDGGEDREHHL